MENGDSLWQPLKREKRVETYKTPSFAVQQVYLPTDFTLNHTHTHTYST